MEAMPNEPQFTQCRWLRQAALNVPRRGKVRPNLQVCNGRTGKMFNRTLEKRTQLRIIRTKEPAWLFSVFNFCRKSHPKLSEVKLRVIIFAPVDLPL
jgi:hypothetical protein